MIAEVPFYSQRPLQQLLLGGVFERFPNLRFVITEAGCAWVPQLLKRLDHILSGIRSKGAVGELRFSEDTVLPLSATEYFTRNVWVGVSQPATGRTPRWHSRSTTATSCGAATITTRGTGPYTREHLRQLFHSTPRTQLEAFLAGNAAHLYDFDVTALAPLAARFGPTVDEIATPLDRLPDHPNEALLKAVAS